jgi:outer membrane lipoprotein-sorting protein
MFRTTAFTVAALVGTLSAQAQTADQIVAKHLQALGGTTALKGIKTLRISGKMVAGQGMEMPLNIEIKKPSLMRMEVSVMGQSMIQVLNGKDSWMVNPMMGSTEPTPMPTEMIEQSEGQATQYEGPLVNYKERGATLELKGKEKLDGADVFQLKLAEKKGQESTLFLDASSYLVSKLINKAKIQGMDVVVTIKMSDYKTVSGLKFAHAMDITTEGMPPMGNSQMLIDKIEVNVPMDESRFQMPKKPAPATAPDPATAPAAKP